MQSQIRIQVLDAIKNGDLRQIKLLAESYDVESIKLEESPDELTSLHLAAAAGELEIAQYLLSNQVRAAPQIARINNFTSLHAAAMNGHTAICEILLEAGANPNVQTTPQGYTPLHSAAYGGHLASVKLLLRHGADSEIRNYRNERPIETAQRQNQDKVVDILEKYSVEQRR